MLGFFAGITAMLAIALLVVALPCLLFFLAVAVFGL